MHLELKAHPKLKAFPKQDRRAAKWLFDNWADAKRAINRLTPANRMRAGLRGIKTAVLEERGAVEERRKVKATAKAAKPAGVAGEAEGKLAT
jgi:hypothetical protein